MNQYRVAIIGAGHRAGAHDRERLEKGQSTGSIRINLRDIGGSRGSSSP